MGRPRTPTKVLQITGAYKAHPERRRNNEPEPSGQIGEAPEHFATQDLRDVWAEFIRITPDGVLTVSDRIHLEVVCQLVIEYRSDPVEFTAAKLTRLESMIGKLGLNPSDRSKVVVPGKPKGNAFNRI
jgi:hypothetical protein